MRDGRALLVRHFIFNLNISIDGRAEIKCYSGRHHALAPSIFRFRERERGLISRAAVQRRAIMRAERTQCSYFLIRFAEDLARLYDTVP